MKRKAFFSANSDGIVLLSYLGRPNRQYCTVTPHFTTGSRSAGAEAQTTMSASRLRVDEKQHAKEAAKGSYFPSVRNDSSFLRVTDTQLIQIAPGTLGNSGGNADSCCEQRH